MTPLSLSLLPAKWHSFKFMKWGVPAITAKLWLFFLKLKLGTRGALTVNILREIGDYLTDLPSLAYLSVDGKRLCVLSLASMHLQTYGNIAFMKHSLCLVDSSKLFCLQGRVSTYYPYLIHLDTFRQTALRPMRQSRLHPGVALLAGHVYLFAGGTAACERYALSADQWTPIANYPLVASRLSTCTHRDQVYTAVESRKHMYVYSALQDWFDTIKLAAAFRGQLFYIGDSEFVFFDKYTASKMRIQKQTAETLYKAEGLLLLFHDWKRTGVHANAMASSLGVVQWNRKVYVPLSDFGSGEGDKLGVFDITGRKVEIRSIASSE